MRVSRQHSSELARFFDYHPAAWKAALGGVLFGFFAFAHLAYRSRGLKRAWWSLLTASQAAQVVGLWSVRSTR